MKKTVLFSVLALTASVFADDGLVAAAQKMDNTSQPQTTNNNQMMNQVVLTSARPESDNGWYLFADALYWHADVGNADWGSKASINTAGDQLTVVDHHLDFKWSWGFKVGLGVNMDHDMWDSNLSYTWFHTENSNAMGSEGEHTTVLPTDDDMTSSKHHWDIHFSMFDWELGRWYYTSKNLALRPHVGVKGGWINQHRKTVGSGQADQQSTIISLNQVGNFKNDFWGVGPSAGVNTLWVLGNAGSAMDHRFSLFGDFAGALMYGHFHNTFSSTTKGTGGLSPLSETGTVKNMDRNLAVTMLQGIMGLSWDTAFNRGRNHFMMRVGYEFQYWFRQNQYLSAKELNSKGMSGALRVSDDLALQGLTVDFRFDF